MKIRCLVILMMFCVLDIVGQRPGILDLENDRPVDQPECFSVLWDFQGVDYINAECDDQPEVRVIITPRNCYESMISWWDCSHGRTEIWVNGVMQETFGDPVLNSSNQSIITIGQYDLSVLSDFCITVRNFKKCPFSGETIESEETECIPVYRAGDSWTVERKGNVKIERLPCIDDPQFMVCCGATDGSKEIAFTSVVTAGEQNVKTVGVEVGGSLVGGVLEATIPVNYNNNTSASISVTESITLAHNITIDQVDGACQSFQFVLNLRELWEDRYSIEDCGDEGVYQSNFMGYYLFSIDLSKCTVVECGGFHPTFASLPSSRIFANGCSGDVIVDIDNTEDIVSYSWEGPNGFKSVEEDLIDVPYGVYTLTISDACCQTYTYTYNHCGEDGSESDWESVGTDDTYCKTYYCGAEDCDIPEMMICEEADSEVSYDNGVCYKSFYINEERVNQVSEVGDVQLVADEFNMLCKEYVICFNERIELSTSALTEEITYDEFSQLCTKVLKCDGVEVSNDISFPIYTGPWQYTEWQGCTKIVQCDIGHQEDLASDVEFRNWDYNSFTSLCVADVYCDGLPVFATTHSEIPVFEGPWDWSNTRPPGQQCQRSITCGFGAGSTQVTESAIETFVSTGADCPFDESNTRFEVWCDGIPTGTYTCFTSSSGGSEYRSQGEAGSDLDLVTLYSDGHTGAYFIRNNGLSSTVQVTLYSLGGRTLGKHEIAPGSQYGVAKNGNMSGIVLAVCRRGDTYFTFKMLL